jgi:AraC-like DNA-binding protein
MATVVPVRVGLPVIGDGHQFRVAAAQVLEPLADAFRVLLVEGAAATLLDETGRRLDPPVLLVIPPGPRGRVRLGRGAFCYRFDLDGGPGLRALLGSAPRCWQGPAAAPWRGELIAIAQRWWRSLADRQRVAVHLVDLLLRADAATLDPDQAAQSLESRFQALVREHLGSEERAPALARRLGVSRITLDRVLVRSTGRTAAAWIRAERLRAAAEMLRHHGRPFAEVGPSCGFADPDSFARAFRRQYGCTPRAWVRRHGRAT